MPVRELEARLAVVADVAVVPGIEIDRLFEPRHRVVQGPAVAAMGERHAEVVAGGGVRGLGRDDRLQGGAGFRVLAVLVKSDRRPDGDRGPEGACGERDDCERPKVHAPLFVAERLDRDQAERPCWPG